MNQKEQPKILTVTEMLENIEQKKFHKNLENIRLLTEYQEMKLVKAKVLKENSRAIFIAFGSVILFYISILIFAIAIKIVK